MKVSIGAAVRMPGSVEEQFCKDVLACVDELNKVLPRLRARYDNLAIVCALAEHVGSALQIFRQAGTFSPEQVERVLAHIRESAYADQSAPGPLAAK